MFLRITCLCLAIGFPSLLQAQKVDIDLVRKVGEEVLISTSLRATTSTTVTEGEKTETGKIQLKASAEMIDVLESIEDDQPIHRRLYLSERIEANGIVCDIGFDGIELQYRLDDDGDADCIGPDERFCDIARLGHEANRLHGITGWLPFKASLQVGDTTELDITPLIPDLLGDAELEGQAQAKLELVAVDEKAGMADFSGQVTADLRSSTDESSRSHWELDCRMRISLKAQRIASIQLNGKGEIEAQNGEATIRSQVDLKSDWKSELGAAVTKARKKKTVFRDARREFRGKGVSADLPSHYGYLGVSVGFGAEATGFMSMLDGPESSRKIGARTVPTPDNASMEVVNASAKLLKEKYPDATFENITTKAGKGLSMTLQVEDSIHVQDYIGGKGQVIILFYVAPLADKKVLLDEIKTVRKTIQQD